MEVDFQGIRERLGRQPIVEIEKAQEYIVERVNQDGEHSVG